jgi:hypothetical protein
MTRSLKWHSRFYGAHFWSLADTRLEAVIRQIFRCEATGVRRVVRAVSTPSCIAAA